MNTTACRRLVLGLAAFCAAAARAATSPGVEPAAARCLRLAELSSCHSALAANPNDPGLLVAEGDALVALTRPGEAIGVYRNAGRSGAGPAAVAAKIAAAEEQRRTLLDACRREAGRAAERACAAAWLPGAPDEVMVFKRRGRLLQADNQPAAALEAYLSAARLSPRDREVARAVLELSAVIERPDAATLTARGAAQLALRRRRSATAAVAAPESRSPVGRSNGVYSNEAPVTRTN